MLVFLSIPIKCIVSDVLCFYLLFIRPMTKWSSLFVVPVKENDNFASDLLTTLARTFLRYFWSLYYISEDNYSKCSLSRIIIHALVSLYSVFVAKDNKTKCIFNPFLWSIYNYFMTLFNHLWLTVYFYAIICVRLKWVGSDQLLEFFLRLMDIRVIDHFR